MSDDPAPRTGFCVRMLLARLAFTLGSRKIIVLYLAPLSSRPVGTGTCSGSSLMPAAVFSLLLLAFDSIAVVFVASGAFALAVGWIARHLPRTM